jgi:hypothetical protein
MAKETPMTDTSRPASVFLYLVAGVRYNLPEDLRGLEGDALLDAVMLRIEPESLLRGILSPNVEYVQYADDVLGMLVDYEGDDEYENSKFVATGTGHDYLPTP